MNRRFRILSALLHYPDEALRAALPEITEAIATSGFGDRHARALARLCRRLAAGELLDRQEAYSTLFDRGRSCSLNLFEHVHGDTRNRGPAMVALVEAYHAAGWAAPANELPDYLPLFLEFLAVAPEPLTRDLLTQAAPILDQLHARLAGRGTADARAYAGVIAAMLAEAGRAPEAPPAPAEEDDPEAIDRAWEDAPVTFGPENDPDKEGARSKVAAMIKRLRTLRASQPTR
ncbi:nitrate reductase molybdenum cofactor assembly chaperone [Elioraea rosea]|uniref:nitrate reductase molybdenum cofactor assembly chaperone n=1 Tax=Elioraea rosea TaxID=2492390 RepID=UPI001182CC27|nr:nitrate reductase molybdenum cofactor assembly chaperone [Elioraea rosea]